MGDMASGGAPRTKNIVERLTEIAGAISNGQMSTSLRDGTGSEIGTPSNPLIVDIGGEVPDTLDLARVAGAATAVGAGVANPGTIRVVNASDDVNLTGILSKLDTELSTRASEATLAAQLDITLSALRDAVLGASGNDLTTLQAALDAIALDAVSLPEIKAATEATRTSVEALTADVAALKSRANKAATPVVTVATGSGAIAMSYAPGVAFWLDNVTVHFSVAPTTAGNLNVTLGAADGAVYDVVLLSIDPSATAATDICHIPIHPHLCAAGDQIRVEYANADLVTYGVRIVTREA